MSARQLMAPKVSFSFLLCCRWRPKVERSQHHSSSAGCLSVEVRTRKGNNHKSGLLWTVVNF